MENSLKSKLDSFINSINNFELVNLPVELTRTVDFFEVKEFNAEEFILKGMFSTQYHQSGHYCLVTKDLVEDLSAVLKDKRCLEVMSGKGLLSHHLKASGIDLVATDDKSWKSLSIENHVESISGIDAIEKYKNSSDILLIIWPPYDKPDAHQIIKAWGTEKPIIFCGEGKLGCTADDGFFEHYKATRLDVRYTPLDGLHDYFHIGHYSVDKLTENII